MLFNIIGRDFSFYENIIIIVAYAFAIIVALVMHEYAHARTALRQGDPTAKLAGRLSLNPARHFDMLGLLCFVFVGFGWAKPVPVNPFNYRNFKRGNFLVSISGIVTNLIIAFVCSLGCFLLFKSDVSNVFAFAGFYFFYFAMVINISLAVFNLLPLPPLDGYNMLVSLTKPNNRFMQFVRDNGMMLLLLVMIFGGIIIGPVRDALLDLFIDFWGLFL